MKKKLIIVLGLVLVVGLGGAYKLVLAKKPAKEKIAGQVYVLPKDFLVNLADGRFAKLDVALVLEKGYSAKPAGGEGAAEPPEGFGTLPEEAAVRDIVTGVITDASGRTLISRSGRERLKRRILRQIQRSTDVEATAVLFTDVAVQ